MSSAEPETKVISTLSHGHDSMSASSSLAESLVGVIDRLGRYVLIERLGRGAFGTVWMAFDPQLDRRVAIKIVHGRRSADGEVDKTRDDLLSEAQLLAQLSHPNVVAIHDVGRLEDALGSTHTAVLDSGTDEDVLGVFIVMEHLDGLTLAEWLRGDDRSEPPTQTDEAVRADGDFQPARVLRELTEILRVFGEAGRGLLAAHARNLAHLDFKPGNVMFGADGRVRVLDFGLARVGRQLRARSDKPGRARVAGTPAYMAPEQHEAKVADGRADQYAFCVSLWEALHSNRPFVGDDPESLYRAKLAGPPRPPRTSIAPAHVLAALERGLSVDPEQRFASMDALLAVLADDPRLRRRRWIAGVIVVAGLVGAGFGLAQVSDEQGDPCELPADQFFEVWDDARRAEVEAAFEATGVDFAAETFGRVAASLDEELERWSAVRRDVCRATLVDNSVRVEFMGEQMLCLDRSLRRIAGLSETLTKADAEIVARAMDSVLALDDPERCRIHDEEGRALVGDDRRLALLSVEDALARAQVLGDLGRDADGLAAAEQAVDLATDLDDLGGLARAQRERGDLLRKLGRYDESAEASMAALAPAARIDARELESRILNDLVLSYAMRGEYDAALALRELLRSRVDPDQTPELAVMVHIHAALLHERQQHWDEALAEAEAAREIVEAKLDDDSLLLGQVHLNIGNVLVGSGRDREQGAAAYRLAIEQWTAAYGDHHPLLAKASINLSSVHFYRKDYARAIELLESALSLLEDIYDADHPYIGVCYQNLGALHMVVGEFHEALRYTRNSLELSGAMLGTDHPDYATVERNLASLLMLMGDYRGAREHFVHAATVYAKSLDSEDTRRMALQAELAEITWWFGDRDEAARYLAEAELRLAQAELADQRRIGPLSTLAMIELHDGELDAALAHALELVEYCEATQDASNVARARVLLGEILRTLGRHEEAREQLDSALAKLTRDDGSEHLHAWGVHFELGRLALAEGDRATALDELGKALTIAEGPEGSKVNAALVKLELGDALWASERARAEQLTVEALEALREQEVRPELRARAQARLGG